MTATDHEPHFCHIRNGDVSHADAMVAAFVAGMNLAIDATAGERERASLRPLLLCPVPTRALALGKGLAAATFSGLGVLLTLAVTVVVLGAAPGAGARLSVGLRDLPILLAILLPVAPLAGALQMLVATFCRSYKEAQTYLSLLLLLPMVPGFAVALYGVELTARASLVPILGQQMLLEAALEKLSPAERATAEQKLNDLRQKEADHAEPDHGGAAARRRARALAG